MNKFPKEIFIKKVIENMGNDEEIAWYTAHENMEETTTVGTTETVGVYKLVEVRKVTGAVTYKSRKVKNAA